MNNWKKSALAATAAVTTTLALTACSPQEDDGKLQVLAAFYPLQFVTEYIGGKYVTIDSLTPQGAEPHDIELAPAHTRAIGTADLVIYQSGFQAAVDEAIEARNPEHVYDAAVHAQLEPGHSHSEDEHADEEAAGDGHDHGATDPHFWLDPTLLAHVAEDINAQLAKQDPKNASAFQENTDKLLEELATLDKNYTEDLKTCEQRSIVVTHEAFGYLAHKYDFEQVGITGIDPETEPSPAQLRSVKEHIAEHNITTIFFETLTSPKVAQTLAQDLNVATRVLDPIEGLVDPNETYLTVMEANLQALKTGMHCS